MARVGTLSENIADLDWAYLAGLIDGEGSIRIEGGPTTRRFAGTPTVTLTNTSTKMIDWAFDKFGGHLYKKKNRSCWDIYWLGKAVIPILEGVYPYLTAKKDQADIVFAYRKLVRRSGNGSIASDVWDTRNILLDVLAYLKRNQDESKKEVM